MKTKIKNVVVTCSFLMLFTMAFTSTAFSYCSVTCAAVCRYTCEFESYGSCSDKQLNDKVRTCCDGAFAANPSINDEPCTVSGGEY